MQIKYLSYLLLFPNFLFDEEAKDAFREDGTPKTKAEV